MIPTGRIPPAEPVSTGNIRLGTWTFSYGGLTVCIRRRESDLARYFVATVGKRLWATVPFRVVLDLCSQRSNCVPGSLLVATAHTASRLRSVVGDYILLEIVDTYLGLLRPIVGLGFHTSLLVKDGRLMDDDYLMACHLAHET